MNQVISEKSSRGSSRNFLGTLPIGRLLFKMSLPATVGMLVNGLYNIIDTIFVGHAVGPLAIGGLGIAFPIQMLVFGFAFAIGNGAGSVVSRALGAQDMQRADQTLGSAISLALGVGVILFLISLLSLEELIILIGASPEILPFAAEYLSIILFGAPVIVLAVSCNQIVRAEGRAGVSMVAMLIGAGGNILLDWWFVIGLEMGVRGAAIATVVSRGGAFLVLAIYLLSGKSALKITLRNMKPWGEVAGEIVKLGSVQILRQAGQSILMVVINHQLGRYGTNLHIAAYGILNRIMMFGFMPLAGIVQGFQPIAGYNFGAKKYDRVRKSVKITSIVASVESLAFLLPMVIIPAQILSVFTSDLNLVTIGSAALPIVMVVVPLLGFQFVSSTYFLSIGQVIPAAILTLSRQLIFLLPSIVLIPRFLGVKGVWLSFPVADGLSFLLAVIWLFVAIKKLGNSKN